MLRTYVYWFFVFIWCGLIFLQSSKTGSGSAQQSMELGAYLYESFHVVLRFLSFDFWHFLLRKLSHFFSYCILGFLLYQAFVVSGLKKNIWQYTLLWGMLYAISDEVHQAFVPGREASLRDVLIDSLGVLFACFLMRYFHNSSFSNQKEVSR